MYVCVYAYKCTYIYMGSSSWHLKSFDLEPIDEVPQNHHKQGPSSRGEDNVSKGLPSMHAAPSIHACLHSWPYYNTDCTEEGYNNM